MVPSWLDDEAGLEDEADAQDLEPDPRVGDPAPEPAADGLQGDDDDAAAAPLGEDATSRFFAPRRLLTRWAVSSGTERRLGQRSLGRYARDSLGGGDSASQRLVRGRQATERLYTTLRDLRTRGVEAVLRELGLETFIGRSAEDVITALVDIICIEGSTLDDELVRNAFLDTIPVITDEGIVDFSTITDRQVEHVLIVFVCNVIRERYLLDCSERAVGRALTDNGAGTLKADVGGMIQDLVGAQLDGSLSSGRALTGTELSQTIDSVYKRVIGLLIVAADV